MAKPLKPVVSEEQRLDAAQWLLNRATNITRLALSQGCNLGDAALILALADRPGWVTAGELAEHLGMGYVNDTTYVIRRLRRILRKAKGLVERLEDGPRVLWRVHGSLVVGGAANTKPVVLKQEREDKYLVLIDRLIKECPPKRRALWQAEVVAIFNPKGT